MEEARKFLQKTFPHGVVIYTPTSQDAEHLLSYLGNLGITWEWRDKIDVLDSSWVARKKRTAYRLNTQTLRLNRGSRNTYDDLIYIHYTKLNAAEFFSIVEDDTELNPDVLLSFLEK